MILVFSYTDKKVWAYGENIYGFQTHYEIQNQYIWGEYLVIEGFYYIYELQNFTDNTKGTGTHYYYLELNNSYNNFVYYDSGGYYIDLTDIEYKSGYPWASSGESDLVWPHQSGYNYRYRDIGFQFIIPLSDLKKFNGTSTLWNMKINCVATNTYNGKGVEIGFKQEKIYASKAFATIPFQDYIISPYTNLDKWASNIYADVGYVRSAPGKSSSVVKYYGSNLYWAQSEVFYDLSWNSLASSGSNSVTWYGLQFGNIYHDGRRYRARYASNSGMYGWIPSVFMGTLNGTPYTITVVNKPPAITANDILIKEGTNITESLLLKGVTAYDFSFGNKSPSIKSTNLTLNSTKNKVGTYSVTFTATDVNLAESTKTINVTIENVPPQINAADKEINYGNLLTKEFLLKDISAYDVYDGDLTDKVILYHISGLILDSEINNYGIYAIIYAVKDSNGAYTYKTVYLKILYRHIRAIEKNSINTLSENSKWKNPILYENLETILNQNTDKMKYVQIWKFTNKERIDIQKYMTMNKPSKETIEWFLQNYEQCKVK